MTSLSLTYLRVILFYLYFNIYYNELSLMLLLKINDTCSMIRYYIFILFVLFVILFLNGKQIYLIVKK